MEQWNNFIALEYAPYILMLVGGLLVLFGIMKILGSSLKLLMWVIFVALGSVAINYGWGMTSAGSEVSLSEELKDLIEPGKDLTEDAIRKMCEKIGFADGLTDEGTFGKSE